jgi:hypothetical protein
MLEMIAPTGLTRRERCRMPARMCGSGQDVAHLRSRQSFTACQNLKFMRARTVWMARSVEPWSGLVPPVPSAIARASVVVGKLANKYSSLNASSFLIHCGYVPRFLQSSDVLGRAAHVRRDESTRR